MGHIYSNFCLHALQKRIGPPGDGFMENSAVVFSPHYDDETLGVGGTIIQKRRAGAPVYLVFMTDGSRSHAAAMDGSRLSALRKQEAIDAAGALGVPESHVRFLEFPETHLAQHTGAAVERVFEILSELGCRQVFVPSTLEPLIWSADHNVTTDIVFRAMARLDEQPEVVEYLVWFWYSWPWVRVRRGADARQILKLTWKSGFGLAAWIGLNTAVPIAAVRSQKRAALEEYKSQMTRLASNKPWPVLADVANGEFLQCFFHSAEFFKRHRYAGAARSKK
jgi:LmbE family N-acetylglucosaminyl deacetylase